MTDRTHGYAQAVVALADSEDALDTVEDELLTIARAVDDNPALREQLTDVNLPLAHRMAFVESEVLTAAHPATRSALAAIIAAGRAGDLFDIAQEVARQAATSRERELAEVYVAVALDDAQRDELTRALEEATGKDLDVKVFVDPSLVGGVRARIGDSVIDGSVARRLSDIRTRVVR